MDGIACLQQRARSEITEQQLALWLSGSAGRLPEPSNCVYIACFMHREGGKFLEAHSGVLGKRRYTASDRARHLSMLKPEHTHAMPAIQLGANRRPWNHLLYMSSDQTECGV